MKAIKTLIPAILFSVVASTAITAQASNLDLYTTNNDFSGVTARVYQDGKPVEGANIQLFSNGKILRSEKITNNNGRADFNFVKGSNSVVIKVSSVGSEKSQWVKLERGSKG